MHIILVSIYFCGQMLRCTGMEQVRFAINILNQHKIRFERNWIINEIDTFWIIQKYDEESKDFPNSIAYYQWNAFMAYDLRASVNLLFSGLGVFWWFGLWTQDTGRACFVLIWVKNDIACATASGIKNQVVLGKANIYLQLYFFLVHKNLIQTKLVVGFLLFIQFTFHKFTKKMLLRNAYVSQIKSVSPIPIGRWTFSWLASARWTMAQ